MNASDNSAGAVASARRPWVGRGAPAAGQTNHETKPGIQGRANVSFRQFEYDNVVGIHVP